MSCGVYNIGEKINFICTAHRFVSGQKYDGTVWLHYAKYDVGWAGRVSVQMNNFGGNTGLYIKTIEAGAIGIGLYWLVYEANIDLVIGWQKYMFRIQNKPMWLLGMF